MEKIKVLHLIKSLGRGGAETLLVETLKKHDATAFEFHFIYFLPWKNQLVDDLKKNGGIVINIPADNNIKILLSANKLVRYIKDYDIDIIHCHLPWAGFLGRLVKKMVKKPVFYTEHNKQERYHLLTKLLNKFSFNSQNLAIAVSKDVEKSIIENIKPTVPVLTILNGVNTDFFCENEEKKKILKSELGIEEEAIVIGAICVFRVQKRIDKWLEIFAEVYKTNPSVRGIVVGAGPTFDEMIEKRRALGLENVVLMPGLKTNSADWYKIFDIFLMSSEFEGLPLALLEAMSSSCAIVTTNAGGVKEVIHKLEDGFIRDVSDWKNLSIDINHLITNPAILLQYKNAARKRVLEQFSIMEMVQQLEDIYQSTSYGN
jgi:glycosyltransferase involved in cell wall biosynthesis